MKLIELKKELPYTYEAIAHMLEIINVSKDEYDNININSKDWFMWYEWNDKQQEDYADWLYRKLWGDAKFRKEIMQFPIRKKKIIDNTVWQFILNYWLTLKKEDS